MPSRKLISGAREWFAGKTADRRRPQTTQTSSSTLTSTSEPRPHTPTLVAPEPRVPSPTSAAVLQLELCTAQTPRHATTDTASPSGLPGRLWTQAYESVKDDMPDLVDAYETLLRRVLGGESDPEDRKQMDKLVREGLEKTKKEAAAKQKIEDGMHVISSVSELVGTAVKHAPEAAAAWGGVCLLLKVLENPIKEASANRDGITYVTSRIEWYWKLSALLERDQGPAAGLRDQLEERIIDLYKRLLLYQMNSVCSCYRNRIAVTLRDAVKFDNWTEAVQSLKAAEAIVQRDIDTHVAQEIRMSLDKVATESEHRRTQLSQIYQTLQEFISLQIAMRRDDDNMACLRALYVVNPQDDMTRIEDNKGKLFYNAYEWILRSSEYVAFTTWGESDIPPCRLLWIKGQAGTGKTMLLVGIIRKLSNQLAAHAPSLSYFFCQGTGTKKLSSATAVLRSLIWMLLVQQPALILYLQNAYKHSGEALFHDGNEFYALSRVFQNMLKDPSLLPVYLIVDALDECDRTKPGLEELIEFISISLRLSEKVKWLLSSRPEVDILGQLRRRGSPSQCIPDALVELDTESLEGPVSAYIEHKLYGLKSSNLGHTYTKEILETVSTKVHQRAKDNFLWVYLVFEDLKSVRGSYAVRSISHYPSGLSMLYDHKMSRIEGEETTRLQHCKDVLIATLLAYRPLSLDELAVLVPWAADTDPYTIVEKCSSFLAIAGETVNLVHQSAKDYLEENYKSRLQSAGPGEGHANIGRRSINAMTLILAQKNLYKLDFDFMPKDMTPPHPDPLAPIRYSCVFWADHLCSESPEYRTEFLDDGLVLGFLNERFLCWLESLSLLGKLSDGILSVRKLVDVVQVDMSPRLSRLLEDAVKFVLSHRSIIERAPLQTYGSALVFSPMMSEVRVAYWKEKLPFIRKVAGIRDYWSAYRQTLEGHSHTVTAVAFSQDGKTLASASTDQTIRLWDAATGTHKQTLEGHSHRVMAVAFSQDGKTLASASDDHTIRLWDAETGMHQQTLEGHSHQVMAVAFSRDSKMLASASADLTIRLWDAATGIHQQTLEGHSHRVRAVAFSQDGKTLASASADQTIRLWDAATGIHQQTLEGHSHHVTAIAFSQDGKTLASASADHTIRLWDAATGMHQQTLKGHSYFIADVAFSRDSKTLASASADIWLWDAATCIHQQTLEGHSNLVRAVAFSQDGKTLASASADQTIRLWDVAIGMHQQTLKGHSDSVKAMAFSQDGKMLASASDDQTIRLWDAATGIHQQTLKGHSDWVIAIAFSQDGKMLASASADQTIRLWDAATGMHQQTLKEHFDWVTAVAFSRDSKTLASASDDQTIRLWDTETGMHQQTLEGHSDLVTAVAFSQDGKTLASASDDQTLRLWDTATGMHQQTLEGHSHRVRAVAFSQDGKTLASASADQTIRLWDAETGMHQQTLEGHSDWITAVAFSPDGYLETNRGRLSINSNPNASTCSTGSNLMRRGLFVSGEWVAEDGKNLVWLPFSYRARCVAVYDRIVVLGHATGEVTFLYF